MSNIFETNLCSICIVHFFSLYVKVPQFVSHVPGQFCYFQFWGILNDIIKNVYVQVFELL